MRLSVAVNSLVKLKGRRSTSAILLGAMGFAETKAPLRTLQGRRRVLVEKCIMKLGF